MERQLSGGQRMVQALGIAAATEDEDEVSKPSELLCVGCARHIKSNYVYNEGTGEWHSECYLLRKMFLETEFGDDAEPFEDIELIILYWRNLFFDRSEELNEQKLLLDAVSSREAGLNRILSDLKDSREGSFEDIAGGDASQRDAAFLNMQVENALLKAQLKEATDRLAAPVERPAPLVAAADASNGDAAPSLAEQLAQALEQVAQRDRTLEEERRLHASQLAAAKESTPAYLETIRVLTGELDDMQSTNERLRLQHNAAVEEFRTMYAELQERVHAMEAERLESSSSQDTVLFDLNTKFNELQAKYDLLLREVDKDKLAALKMTRVASSGRVAIDTSGRRSAHEAASPMTPLPEPQMRHPHARQAHAPEARYGIPISLVPTASSMRRSSQASNSADGADESASGRPSSTGGSPAAASPLAERGDSPKTPATNADLDSPKTPGSAAAVGAAMRVKVVVPGEYSEIKMSPEWIPVRASLRGSSLRLTTKSDQLFALLNVAGGTVESYADESADLHMDSTFGFDSLTSALSVLLLRTVTDGEFLLDVAADELANWSARLQDACRLKSATMARRSHCIPHKFKEENFWLHPTKCKSCQTSIHTRGYRCNYCDTSCHERCVPRIPPDCGLVSMASLRAALDGSSPTSRKGMVESATRAVKTALSRKRTPEEEKLKGRPNSIITKSLDRLGADAFGVPLEHAPCEDDEVPLIIRACVSAIERRGLDIEGLYRLSGVKKDIERVRLHLSFGRPNFDDEGEWPDVHVITGAVKMWFRELPDPVIPFASFNEFAQITAGEPKLDEETRIARLKAAIEKIPKRNRIVLLYFITHLNRVAAHSNENKMLPQNLGAVFGPTLMRSPTDDIGALQAQCVTVELLVRRASDIFV